MTVENNYSSKTLPREDHCKIIHHTISFKERLMHIYTGNITRNVKNFL